MNLNINVTIKFATENNETKEEAIHRLEAILDDIGLLYDIASFDETKHE